MAQGRLSYVHSRRIGRVRAGPAEDAGLFAQGAPMSADPAAAGDAAQEAQEKQMPPVPDEAGPRDVPDQDVIEKTLPSKPLPGAEPLDR